MNRKLRSALRAARRGLPIIPLCCVEEDGDCSCGDPDCTSVGKHPITAHGVHDVTTNRSAIRRWWRENPNANIGVATGKTSDLIVVDVDRGHGGVESLKRFEEETGPLPEGPAVRTGGGGLHLYFKASGNNIGNKVGVLPGVD